MVGVSVACRPSRDRQHDLLAATAGEGLAEDLLRLAAGVPVGAALDGWRG